MLLVIRIVIAVAISLSVSSSVHAKSRVMLYPLVSLQSVEGGTAAAAEMTQALREELALSSGLLVIDGRFPDNSAQSRVQSRRPAKSATLYRRALRRLEKAEDLADRLRFDSAISELKRAVALMVRNLEVVQDYDNLLDAQLLLSVAYFRRGKQSPGTDVLQEIARLRPNLDLDPDRYPPMFRTIFARVQQRALARGRGSLRVSTDEGQAEVWLNGRNLGAAPLVVDSVIPGENHLQVRFPDGSIWAEVIAVREGQVADIRANVRGSADSADASLVQVIAGNRFDQRARTTLLDGARRRRAAYVVAAAVGSGDGVFSIDGFLGDTSSGAWVRLPSIAPDTDMLAASIEAHRWVERIESYLDGFDPSVGDEEVVAFVEGKAVAGLDKAGSVSRVQFAEVGTQSLGGRKPVGADPDLAGGNVSVPVPRESDRRVPLVRSTSGPKVEGPVLASREVLGEPDLMPQKAIDAVDVGRGQLAVRDLDAEAYASVQDSVWGEWWLWTTVGASVATVGVVTWFMASHDAEPTGVIVTAEW